MNSIISPSNNQHTNTKTPPKFLRCLYHMLQHEDQTVLAWDATGAFFRVFDVARLEQSVLPKYFKHGRFASFQRQLNNFHFHKWTKSLSHVCTFSHDTLTRDHASHLHSYVRPRSASYSGMVVTTKRRMSDADDELQQEQQSIPTKRAKSHQYDDDNNNQDEEEEQVKMLLSILDQDEPLELCCLDVHDLVALEWDLVIIDDAEQLELESLIVEDEDLLAGLSKTQQLLDWEASSLVLESVETDDLLELVDGLLDSYRCGVYHL